jgi:hypothetical protein
MSFKQANRARLELGVHAMAGDPRGDQHLAVAGEEVTGYDITVMENCWPQGNHAWFEIDDLTRPQAAGIAAMLTEILGLRAEWRGGDP